MIVILIGLSFAVLAALAISSARNDYRLTCELADHTSAYYEASNEAQRRLAQTEELYEQRDADGRMSFSVDVNENQELCVSVVFGKDASDYKIEQWQVINNSEWSGDDSLPGLWMGE
jgi:uncharacterized protein YfiM (DUF2279 family)